MRSSAILLLIAVALPLNARAADCNGTDAARCKAFLDSNRPLVVEKKPPQALLKAIQDEIDLGNGYASARTKVAIDRADTLNKLPKEIDYLDWSIKGLQGGHEFGWQKELRANIYAERSKKLYDLDKQAAEARKRQYEHFNRAIQLTIAAYHLTPGVVEAPDHPEVNLARMTVKRWNPHFSEDEVLYHIDGQPYTVLHGRPMNRKEKLDLGKRMGLPKDQEGAVLGGTSTIDANVAIFGAAFTDPGHLASAIYHETCHWLDDAASGQRPSAPDEFESESRAYRQMTRFPVFGLTKSEEARYQAAAIRYEDQARKAAGERILSHAQAMDRHPDWLPLYSFGGASPDDLSVPGLTDDENTALDVGDHLRKIRDDADKLRARVMREDQERQSAEFNRRARPPTQLVPPPTAPVIDFPTAPSDAWDIAIRICGGGTISQDDLDLAVGRLGVYRKYHGFAVPPVTSCETQIFAAMAGSNSRSGPLSARWVNSLTRRSYCQSAAAEGNAIYRETVRAARRACHESGGIDDEEISRIVTRSYSNGDAPVVLDQLDACESGIYFMLCEGNSSARDWSAGQINAKAHELTAGISHPKPDGGGSIPSGDSDTRSDRSRNIDLSRPITFVGGLHPHF